MFRRILKVLGIGVLIGVTLGVVSTVFEWSDATLWTVFAVGALLVLTGHIAYTLTYTKRNQEALKLLEAQKTEEYLQVMEKYYQQVKTRELKNLFRLNMTAGYCELKQYPEAEAILEELADARLYGMQEMVRRLNLCFCYFQRGETEKALQLNAESEKLFNRFRKNPAYATNFIFLDIHVANAQGKTENLRAMLTKAQEKCTSARLQNTLDELDALLKSKGL